MLKQSYRESHKYAEKGAEYETYYQTEAWDRFIWSREREIIQRILEKHFAEMDIHLLDFACGTGRITSFLENRVKTSIGIDVSDSMLVIARKKLKRTKIIKVDITEENILKPRRFNLITAFRFFLNAEPQLRLEAIRALVDLLFEGGCLILNNHRNFASPWVKLLYMRHRQRDPENIFNVMSIEEMKKLVEGVGLEIVEIYPVGFFHPPKIPVSYSVNRAIDNIACRFKFLSRLSESLIVVCRHRLNQNMCASSSG